jgi:2-keto-4-pentenoate hydratase/2-oxohepta-3-ene-1,7-dioic acid hydratase in catechol pathway
MTEDGIAVDVSARVADLDGDFFASGGVGKLRDVDLHSLGPAIDLSTTRLGPPIARPPKLICIGLNYADHAAESGLPIPTEPVTFFKATNTIVGPNDEVLLPIGGLKTDWEIELAVLVGRTCRYLRGEEEADEAIVGYAISNDISERAFQLERGGQWMKGKSCETFNPLGPWLVTKDDLPDVSALEMVLRVNGDVVQHGSTSAMVVRPPYLVWYLSQFMILEPGDLINTGTPAGVGLGRRPPRYLAPGDVMELSITGLGTQRQVCRRAVV